uniref:Calponin-homology (CH) domain-containing protein n=1 Tax=Globisporangium ultimum (strain ATCC 200006 / CBS 805.95 / DAOM BR144) TaxID=431595 RepID=K3X854_GLOUD
MEQILGDKLPATDLHEALRSGIVLRELQEKLFPDTARCFSPISRNYSSRMAPWKERENISVFLKQCKALGMNDLSLFCTDDLYDGNNMVQHFMQFSQEHSSHFFHPVYDEHMTFSNQEVEMALSKIEKAGVDAGMLKDLMVGSGSPPKKAGRLDDSDAETVSETEKDFAAGFQVENDKNTLKELEHELRELDGSKSCNQENGLTTVRHEVGKEEELEPELDSNDDESLNAVEVEADIDRGEIADVLERLLDAVEAYHITTLAIAQSRFEYVCRPGEDEMRLHDLLEEAKHERLPETQISEICETELVIDVFSAHRLESEAKTELMDAGKSETRVLDSTIALHSSRSHEISEDTEVKAANVSKKDKKKAKAAKKKKKNREISDEQLDAEAMSRCTCGNKCAIM